MVVRKKICGQCKVEQPVTNFSRNRTRADGYQTSCKTCCAEKDRLRRGSWHGSKANGLGGWTGITIKPGEAVDVSKAERLVQPSVLSVVPDIPQEIFLDTKGIESMRNGATPELEHVLIREQREEENSGERISCKTWIEYAEYGAAKTRLFVCDGGRFAIERTQTQGSPQFLLWHLCDEFRSSEQAPGDAKHLVALLSFIAPDVLGKSGTVYRT